MTPRPRRKHLNGGNITMTQSNFLTPRQVAQRWNGVVTIGTLANWRSKGVGPTYTKLRGRILYPVAKLEAWEAQNMHAANDDAAPMGAVA